MVSAFAMKCFGQKPAVRYQENEKLKTISYISNEKMTFHHDNEMRLKYLPGNPIIKEKRKK